MVDRLHLSEQLAQSRYPAMHCNGRESNSRSLDHKSDAYNHYTTESPNRSFSANIIMGVHKYRERERETLSFAGVVDSEIASRCQFS